MEYSQLNARYRAGNGASFSSTKCPPSSQLSSQCELPFGFIWTPFSPSDLALNTPDVHELDEALPPLLCLSCLSYLNLFTQIKESDNSWICEICGARNVHLPTEGRFRSIHSPMVEYRQRISQPSVASTIHPASALASSNSCFHHPDPSSVTFIIVMDENLPGIEAQTVAKAINNCFRQSDEENDEKIPKTHKTKIGLIVFGKYVRVYQLGISAGMAVGDVMPSCQENVNLHDDEDESEQSLYLRPYLINSTENNLQSFLRCLSAVYNIDVLDFCHVLDNESSENQTEMSRPLSRLETLKRRKEARVLRQNQDKNGPTRRPMKTRFSSFQQRKKQMQETREAYRSVGDALYVAINLATSTDDPSRTSHILLFTNGCPNYGDGNCVVSSPTSTASVRGGHRRADVVDPLQLQRSVEYFGVLSKAASKLGVGIDVFCSGTLELALPAYQAMVEPSSGSVLSTTSFANDMFAANIQNVIQQTFVSGLLGTTLRDEKWVDGCIVDIRMPSYFTVTHIVGPGELIDESRNLLVNERSAFAVGASFAAAKKFPTNNLPYHDIIETTLTRFRLGRFDPLLTISVMIRLNEFYQHENHALFQFVARHVDRDGKTLVTRVFTHRLAIAKETVEFLDSVDEEVVPVMLAKEAVSRSMMGRELVDHGLVGGAAMVDALQLENLAFLAQRDLDATIQRVSGAFCLLGLEKGGSLLRGLDLTEEGGVKAAGSSIDFAFPPELADGLRRLYHFRRGPLLSPGPMLSDDDRAAYRSHFLRLPLEDCLSMMALSLWSSGPLEEPMEPIMMTVPPDTLSLWDNCILAGDHYFFLFVWSGRATLDPQFDHVREHFKQFLLDRSRNRFPLPTLYMLNENESMSRRFTALLSPSHGDPVDHQLSNFPALNILSVERLRALQSKFKFYDAASDPSFRNWFWSVARASSSCKDEGVSLCE